MVALEKATYGRHDKKGIEKFREHVVVMLENLLGWPQVAGLREEPFPAKTAQRVPGWTLHKLEFSCPRANGNQRQGRLMILVNLPSASSGQSTSIRTLSSRVAFQMKT
jgi:hypothetical protein